MCQSASQRAFELFDVDNCRWNSILRLFDSSALNNSFQSPEQSPLIERRSTAIERNPKWQLAPDGLVGNSVSSQIVLRSAALRAFQTASVAHCVRTIRQCVAFTNVYYPACVAIWLNLNFDHRAFRLRLLELVFSGLMPSNQNLEIRIWSIKSTEIIDQMWVCWLWNPQCGLPQWTSLVNDSNHTVYSLDPTVWILLC